MLYNYNPGSKEYLLNRDVTSHECDWLEETIKEGTIVYRCSRPAYGCIGPGGIAVTFKEDGDYPFFELPLEALTKLPIR